MSPLYLCNSSDGPYAKEKKRLRTKPGALTITSTAQPPVPAENDVSVSILKGQREQSGGAFAKLSL